MTVDGSAVGNATWWYLDRHATGAAARRTCLITQERSVSYGEVHATVTRVARVLEEAGVVPGDRVVMVLPDCVEAVAVVWAAMRIGAVPVPVSPILTVPEQCFVARDSGAALVVLDDAGGPLAAALRGASPAPAVLGRRELMSGSSGADPYTEVAERSAGDPALIQYTSGSTGRPKGVVHLHGGLLAFPHALTRHLQITEDDRMLSSAKLSFGYGFGNSVLLPFAAGASAVLAEGRADPHTVSDLLRTTRPSLFFGVPTLYAALLALPDAATRLERSSVRLAISAGEHLGAVLGARITDTLGLAMVNGLGSTECLHIFLATDPGDYRPGATGQPLPGFEAELLGDDGPVPAGGMGRLRVRGPGTAAGYWRRPDAEAATFRDGWVHTGDVMSRAADGGWHYLGRDDNVLNVGGAKVVTSEVEEAIQRVPGVRACAVVGVPDRQELTRIVAHVVPEPDAGAGLEERLRAALRTSLPPFKRPGTLRFVDALPTTSTGKTARFLIRQDERGRA